MSYSPMDTGLYEAIVDHINNDDFDIKDLTNEESNYIVSVAQEMFSYGYLPDEDELTFIKDALFLLERY